MATYVGVEEVMCNAWIEAQLALQATALNAISTGLSGRIYPDMAPEATDWPCIIYQCQDKPRDIRGVGTFTIMVDTLYLVKAVARTDTYAPLAPIAKVIHTALTQEVGGSVDDGEVLTSVRDNAFSMIEVDKGTQFRHLGGLYKIHAQG
jgi:hypothetical protein